MSSEDVRFNRELITDGDGNFSFANLLAGEPELRSDARNTVKLRVDGLTLSSLVCQILIDRIFREMVSSQTNR